MVYQPTWVIKCQNNPFKMIAVTLFKQLLARRGIREFIPFQGYLSQNNSHGIARVRTRLLRCHNSALHPLQQQFFVGHVNGLQLPYELIILPNSCQWNILFTISNSDIKFEKTAIWWICDPLNFRKDVQFQNESSSEIKYFQISLKVFPIWLLSLYLEIR